MAVLEKMVIVDHDSAVVKGTCGSGPIQAPRFGVSRSAGLLGVVDRGDEGRERGVRFLDPGRGLATLRQGAPGAAGRRKLMGARRGVADARWARG